MGFFSDLKNKVTGGAATVTVQVAPARRGQSSNVLVTVQAKSNIKASGIYLLVRAIETCQVKDTDYQDGKRREETVYGRRTSYETKIQVAGAQQIAEGSTQSFECQLAIPSNANPSFDGKMIEHIWEVQAGVDMTGNDPDSGWVRFEVS
jgi:hypothetical protein